MKHKRAFKRYLHGGVTNPAEAVLMHDFSQRLHNINTDLAALTNKFDTSTATYEDYASLAEKSKELSELYKTLRLGQLKNTEVEAEKLKTLTQSLKTVNDSLLAVTKNVTNNLRVVNNNLATVTRSVNDGLASVRENLSSLKNDMVVNSRRFVNEYAANLGETEKLADRAMQLNDQYTQQMLRHIKYSKRVHGQFLEKASTVKPSEVVGTQLTRAIESAKSKMLPAAAVAGVYYLGVPTTAAALAAYAIPKVTLALFDKIAIGTSHLGFLLNSFIGSISGWKNTVFYYAPGTRAAMQKLYAAEKRINDCNNDSRKLEEKLKRSILRMESDLKPDKEGPIIESEYRVAIRNCIQASKNLKDVLSTITSNVGFGRSFMQEKLKSAMALQQTLDDMISDKMAIHQQYRAYYGELWKRNEVALKNKLGEEEAQKFKLRDVSYE